MKEQQAFVEKNQDGPRFGNYDLVRRIDVGGMGEVYLARQRTAFGREVALKIIRPDLVHDITARKRFLREAEVSAHLKHEHILPLVEFGEEQGRLFLVTPYIAGGTLAHRLQRGPLSLSEVHQLFSSLARAVAYIHKRGVVHRDLKPNNILLDDEEQDQTYVRLIDFGIATIQGHTASPPLTMAGNEMGTVAYMAPERLSGVAAPSNDIYSLGVILYQMLTGELPNTEKAVKLAGPLQTIIDRCTAGNPEDRYASADEVVRAFEYAYRFLSASPKQQSPVLTATKQEAEIDEQPTPRSLPSSRSSYNEPNENIILQHTDSIPAAPVSSFRGEDYNAPTAFVEFSPQAVRHKTGDQPAKAGLSKGARISGKPGKPRKASVLVILTISVIALILAISGIGFLVFQAATTATVTVSPQTHMVSTIFTLTAKPGQHTIDVGTASIPADALSSSKTASQQGPATGISGCVLGIFECKQTVSLNDVEAQTLAMRPGLQAQIAQDLQQKAKAAGATTIGKIYYADTTISADPQVGTESKTVTVTLVEQGSIEFIKNADVTSLTHLLLQQKMQHDLGPNYILLSTLTQIGQPVLVGVDSQGNVTIKIAAGGVAKYQLSPDQLKALQNSMKGMSKQNVSTYLARQKGIDTNATTIHISYGDTMPGTVDQIHLIVVNPTNLPKVQLPPVQ